ncbi:MAG TPA: beta-galactosidase [Vicinamibacterales bacterium]|nr:beta-galactosidase [Vicinamibacterales bacterium]
MRALAIGALACVLVSSSAFQPGQRPFVPVGVWYDGGTAPAGLPADDREAWTRDLQAIRALGFNSIRFEVDWARVEPERGSYRLEALDRLLTVAGQAGLRVIVQLSTDAAPEWLSRTYPDARVVTDEGVRIGSRAGPAYCNDHAGVRAALEAFIEAASSRAARHQSVHAVDVWSGPHIVDPVWSGRAVPTCFCPHSVRRFREWLKAKYGTLDALSRAWNRAFGSWDEPEAPRHGTAGSNTRLIDWQTFVAVKLREDLQVRARAASSRGPRTVVSHSDAPAIMLSPTPGYGIPDDWWMSQVVDRYGMAIYPKHASTTSWEAVRLAAALDGIRSASGDRGWWAGRLQAGQGVTGERTRSPVSAADLRLWGWAALSRGALSISYYTWHSTGSPHASDGYGMIEHDGTISRHARAAGEFAGIISRNASLFAPLTPRASRVAILYNRLSYMAGSSASSADAARDSMLGFYRAMFERNIQADFIHTDEILAGRAAAYSALFLGHSLMLPHGVADALKDYVRAGGTIVSEARPAWNDDRGEASVRTSGVGLDEVFGAREKLLRSPGRIEMIAEADLDGPLAPLAGRSIPGRWFASHLEITGPAARVLARFPASGVGQGDPATVVSSYGSGRAILIGSFPAAAFEQDPIEARQAGDLIAGLAALAGVAPDVRIDGGSGFVESRFLESSAALVLIAINHAETPQKVTMHFAPGTPEAIWQNMETGTAVSFVDGPDGPTYTHAFAPRDVLVLMIGKEIR